MTLEEHNRTLGILYLAYGGLQSLLLAVVMVFMALPLYLMSTIPRGEGPPALFFGLVAAAVMLVSLLMLIPPFVAGYALLKRKAWARTAGIVAAVLATLNFPHGTALAVYSFWFFFGEGARLYRPGLAGRAPYSLSDAPPRPATEWFGEGARQEEAVPRRPPDWR